MIRLDVVLNGRNGLSTVLWNVRVAAVERVESGREEELSAVLSLVLMSAGQRLYEIKLAIPK